MPDGAIGVADRRSRELQSLDRGGNSLPHQCVVRWHHVSQGYVSHRVPLSQLCDVTHSALTNLDDDFALTSLLQQRIILVSKVAQRKLIDPSQAMAVSSTVGRNHEQNPTEPSQRLKTRLLFLRFTALR